MLRYLLFILTFCGLAPLYHLQLMPSIDCFYNLPIYQPSVFTYNFLRKRENLKIDSCGDFNRLGHPDAQQ